MKNKYRNIKTKGFDSKKESLRYLELKQMENDGKIKFLCKQVKFILLPKQEEEREVTYIADFTYNDTKGNYFVEDVKSEITRKLPAYIIKRKLMLYMHEIKISEV